MRRSAALGAAVLALVLVEPAQATWGLNASVSPLPGPAGESDIAISANGLTIIAWERSDGADVRIEARTRSNGGVLSAVQTISPAGQDATEPDVAIAPNGDAVIAWERSDGTDVRVQTRARSAAGVLSAVQTLSPAGADAIRSRVEIDADGDAVYAWQRPGPGGTQIVQGRVRRNTGVLTSVQGLSPTSAISYSPDLAVTPGGDAVFTWARFETVTFQQQIQTRARSAAGVFSPIQTISPTGASASRPHVGVSPATGDAVYVWEGFDGSHLRATTRTRSAAGVLSAVQPISAAGQNAVAPEVAVDPNGNAVYAWERSDGTNTRIQARSRTAAGVFSAIQTLSDPGANASDVEHDVDAEGDAVFTWERSARIQSRTRSFGGSLGAVQLVSQPGASAEEPRIDVHANGSAVASWHGPVGGNVRVQVARGP